MPEIVAEAERARRVRRRLGARRIEIGEQPVERRPVHLMHAERPGEIAAQLDQRLRVRALAHRDVEPAVLLAGRQQAVAAGEGVGNARPGPASVGHLVSAGDPHCGRNAGASTGGCALARRAGLTTWSRGCAPCGTLGGTVPR